MKRTLPDSFAKRNDKAKATNVQDDSPCEGVPCWASVSSLQQVVSAIHPMQAKHTLLLQCLQKLWQKTQRCSNWNRHLSLFTSTILFRNIFLTSFLVVDQVEFTWTTSDRSTLDSARVDWVNPFSILWMISSRRCWSASSMPCYKIPCTSAKLDLSSTMVLEVPSLQLQLHCK